MSKARRFELRKYPELLARVRDLGFLCDKIKEAVEAPQVTANVVKALRGVVQFFDQGFRRALTRLLSVPPGADFSFEEDSEKGPMLVVEVEEAAAPSPPVRRFSLN